MSAGGPSFIASRRHFASRLMSRASDIRFAPPMCTGPDRKGRVNVKLPVSDADRASATGVGARFRGGTGNVAEKAQSRCLGLRARFWATGLSTVVAVQAYAAPPGALRRLSGRWEICTGRHERRVHPWANDEPHAKQQRPKQEQEQREIEERRRQHQRSHHPESADHRDQRPPPPRTPAETAATNTPAAKAADTSNTESPIMRQRPERQLMRDSGRFRSGPRPAQ
jgi:hypothetical protein